jgi:hypothetical protein
MLTPPRLCFGRQACASPRLGLILSERMLNMPPEVRCRARERVRDAAACC